MAQKVYVGNLSYDTTESKLRTLFAEYGEIESISMITDRDTGRPKGFAFVEMATDQAAQAAISALNGKSVDDREIKVNEAKPQADRDRSRTDRRGDRLAAGPAGAIAAHGHLRTLPAHRQRDGGVLDAAGRTGGCGRRRPPGRRSRSARASPAPGAARPARRAGPPAGGACPRGTPTGLVRSGRP